MPAKLAMADAFIRKFPEGYETQLSGDGSNLTQGQKQLLTIARAILADPSILILDEATSSVGTRKELRIQAALKTLMKGGTSFVIAHRLSTIQDADLIVVLNNGEITEHGTHFELLKRKGLYSQLYQNQMANQLCNSDCAMNMSSTFRSHHKLQESLTSKNKRLFFMHEI